MAVDQKYLLNEIESLKKQLGDLELKKVKAEADRLSLLKELDETKKQLITALKNFNSKDFGSSLNIFEESCKSYGEIEYLKAENQRLTSELERNQQENFRLKQQNQELMQFSSAHEEERKSFNESSTKIYQIIADCSEKLKALENDHAKLDKNYESLNTIVKNSMNGIMFLRSQLEMERKQNISLMESKQNLEIIINQLKTGNKGLIGKNEEN